MATTFPIQHLPSELKCAIIRYLDPIALISLSQTNKHFRKTVNPKKIHFVERLLALECDESIGGPSVKFSQFGTLDPDRLSPEWEASRWACSNCMRLLPQHHFATQALSRLAYRKPVPGSPAADVVTSWEPTQMRSRRGRKKKTNKNGKKDGRNVDKSQDVPDAASSLFSDEELQMRRRYGVAMSQVWGGRRRDYYGTIMDASQLTKRFEDLRETGFEEFYNMTYNEYQSMPDEREAEILDRERQAIELVRAGSKRHLRRCLECRFQRGEFRGTCGRKNDNLGTAQVPIVRGRVKYYGLNVDRYFPGLSEALETKRPDVDAPVFVVYREDAVEMPWTQYKVRCPGCGQWKEMRAFRFGGLWPRWQPMEVQNNNIPGYDRYINWESTPVTEEVINDMACNHCFAQANGREALGMELVTWLRANIDTAMRTQQDNLVWGFSHLHGEYTKARKTLKSRIKALVWDLVPLLNKVASKYTREDVSLLSHRFAQLSTQPDLLPESGRDDHWLRERLEHYYDSEAIWSWLQTLSAEIDEPGKAEVLADWVLSRDESVAC